MNRNFIILALTVLQLLTPSLFTGLILPLVHFMHVTLTFYFYISRGNIFTLIWVLLLP